MIVPYFDMLSFVYQTELARFVSEQWVWLATLGVVAFGLWLVVYSSLITRLSRIYYFNWRLGLLVVTGIALSIASGWTTWDGMRNFTAEPILSLLITFGIQSVMLIASWLIGESFTNNAYTRQDGSVLLSWVDDKSISKWLFAAVVSLGALVVVFSTLGNYSLADAYGEFGSPTAGEKIYKLILIAFSSCFAALIVLNLGREIIARYAQSFRTMLGNATLWLMFLACMAASVFFSFDSLFSNIFPSDERARASTIRAQGQVAQIAIDLHEQSVAQMRRQQEKFLTGAQWTGYLKNLNTLSNLAHSAPEALEKLAALDIRSKEENIGNLRSQLANAHSRRDVLQSKVDFAHGAVERLRLGLQSQISEIEQVDGQVSRAELEVSAKTLEAEDEASGIGITGKAGRGPRFRELMVEVKKLKSILTGLQRRQRDAKSRLAKMRSQIASEEAQLALVSSDMAKQGASVETSEKLLSLAVNGQNSERSGSNGETGPIEQSRKLAAARIAFQQQPSLVSLEKLERSCSVLATSLASIPVLKTSAGAVSCKSDRVLVSAGQTFALATGVQALAAKCVGKGRMPQSGQTDQFIEFARDCIQISGLSGKSSTEFHRRLKDIELNRDDKAHRFVVTLNAFADGNKLAYLALAIALAIDGLVFMSGLFGANASRSPLSEIPRRGGRNAQQLTAVIESALLPDPGESAARLLQAMGPTQTLGNSRFDSGWSHEIDLLRVPPGWRRHVSRVLNAGATIGAVERTDGLSEHYRVRGELVEYLAQISRQVAKDDRQTERRVELYAALETVFAPNTLQNVSTVMKHMQPLAENGDYTSVIAFSEVTGFDLAIVRNALNCAASQNYVYCPKSNDTAELYYLHKEFFLALATMSASSSPPARDHQRPSDSDYAAGNGQHTATPRINPPVQLNLDPIGDADRNVANVGNENSIPDRQPETVPTLKIEGPEADCERSRSGAHQKAALSEEGGPDNVNVVPSTLVARIEKVTSLEDAGRPENVLLGPSGVFSDAPSHETPCDQSDLLAASDDPQSAIQSRDRFIASLLARLGLASPIERALPLSPEIIESADRVWRHLEDRTANSSSMSQSLDAFYQRHRVRLDQACVDLRFTIELGGTAQSQDLDEAKHTINNAIHALLISSANGIFHHLSMCLNTNGSKPHDDARGLKEQLDNVVQLSAQLDWHDGAAWQKLEDALQQGDMPEAPQDQQGSQLEASQIQRLSMEVGMDLTELAKAGRGSTGFGEAADSFDLSSPSMHGGQPQTGVALDHANSDEPSLEPKP